MIIKKSELQKALNVVSKSVGGSLPVLNNVLLEVNEEFALIRTTNLTQTTQYLADVEAEGEDWKITVPFRTLNDLVNSLDGENIEITPHEKTAAIDIACKSYKGKMLGISADEFPDFHIVKDKRFWAVDAVDFERMVERVAFAASMDAARPILQGILIDKNTFTASDCFRVSVFRHGEELDREVILPASGMRDVMRIVKAVKAKEIEIHFDDDRQLVMFVAEQATILLPTIEGKFPDIQQIIPKSFKLRAEMKKSSLLNAIKQVSVFSNDAGRIYLDIAEDRMQLSADNENGYSEVSIEAEASGEIKLAVNYDFLRQGVEAVCDEKIVFSLNEKNTPIQITGREGSEYLYILMPMAK